MTTINPMRPFGTNAVVVKSDINDAWTYLGAAGHYKTADLAAALGLVTREALEGSEECRLASERKLAETQAERAALRAELDEAEATIARVKAWYGANQNRDAWSDGKQWRAARESLRAALDPKPAFVLPTEAGAGICARIRTSHEEEELRLFSTGLWMSAYNGAFYTPEAVMDNFTGHRLIGAES